MTNKNRFSTILLTLIISLPLYPQEMIKQAEKYLSLHGMVSIAMR